MHLMVSWNSAILPARGKGCPMKRLLDHFLIDSVAAISMIGMISTGYILRFPLPPGSSKSLTLWTLTRHQWGDIHFWMSLGLIAVILLHVGTHWQWVVISVKRKLSRTKTSSGSGLVSGGVSFLVLSAVLAAFAWAAQNNVELLAEPRNGVCPPSTDNGTIDAGGTIPDEPPNVAFWKDVYPILQRSCLSCHGPKKQRGDFRVDVKVDYFGKNGGRPLVVPGKSLESPLIAILSGNDKDIPLPNLHRLPDEQVAIVRTWIDAGAVWPVRPNRE